MNVTDTLINASQTFGKKAKHRWGKQFFKHQMFTSLSFTLGEIFFNISQEVSQSGLPVLLPAAICDFESIFYFRVW